MNTCCTPRQESARNSNSSASGIKPRYTVDGDKTACSIRVELPGVKKENVALDIDGDVLAIHAKRTASAPAEWKTLHRELVEADFSLRLKLNPTVDAARLTANLNHGVLTIALPVKEAVKPRAIPVG